MKNGFTPSLQGGPPAEVLSLAARRSGAGASLASQAREIALACQAMAARFQRRGKLIVFGDGAAGSDAQNVAVEFLHPVIVGKRALPAICLASDAATLTGAAESDGWGEAFAVPLRRFARPADIALGISARREPENVRRALQAGRELGLLTISLVGERDGASAAVDHRIVVGSGDPLIAREIEVTAYHLLWELVHVFMEQPPSRSRPGA